MATRPGASLDELACVRSLPGPTVADRVRVGTRSGRAASIAGQATAPRTLGGERHRRLASKRQMAPSGVSQGLGIAMVNASRVAYRGTTEAPG